MVIHVLVVLSHRYFGDPLWIGGGDGGPRSCVDTAERICSFGADAGRGTLRVRDGAPCGERVDLTGLDDASGGTLLAPKKGSERRSPYKCAIRLSRGLSLSRIFVLLACAALEAGGARSSSHGYSNPNAGYGTAAFSHYKGKVSQFSKKA
ncbi:hypothetical protein HPB47_025881 [Ixodes persulcatus]|uniref:Uncharacterized protein n=1 Tax=Ixodes persulcatus TaxID=34615 RepID=A0AC60Q0G8_IXOPE|nr:hypothetical protein HPB47_025881 [Ixodes persulcatus]